MKDFDYYATQGVILSTILAFSYLVTTILIDLPALLFFVAPFLCSVAYGAYRHVRE